VASSHYHRPEKFGSRYANADFPKACELFEHTLIGTQLSLGT